MAIEFLRMKLRRASGNTILLSGGAVLHPDGMLDLFGDAIPHGEAIAEAIESVNTGKAPDRLPHSRVLADDCAGCPLTPGTTLRARASSCSCLQIDRFRVGTEESLSPMVLRPGLPPAELPSVTHMAPGSGRPASLWRDFTLFRMARSRNTAQELVAGGARAA